MFEKYQNQDVEQWVLAEFLRDPQLVFKYPNLKDEHFLWEEHRKIFHRVSECASMGFAPVLSRICDTDKERDYVLSLLKVGGTCVNVGDYVSALIDDSRRYDVLCRTESLLREAETDKEVDLFGRLAEISTPDIEEHIRTTPDSMLKELEDRMNKKDIGISTGIPGLDDKINAFQKGRLYVIGARASMGKSALMCSMVERIEKTKKVGIISLEMMDKELIQRMACIRANIPHWHIEKGRCSDDEFSKYGVTLQTFKNVFINDVGGMNRQQVLGVIRQLVKKARCNIVFIDHLGLIRVNGKGNLAHEIGENTSMLKAVAKELDIPVVALCQINRSVEKDVVKKPKMSDLRDSGRIEEDADTVVLLYREGYYTGIEAPSEPCEYIVTKCRNGKCGTVPGTFTGEIMRFD